MLIGATLRSSSHERLGSMRRLAEFLGLAKIDSDEELVKLAKSDLLTVRLRDTDSRFEQDNPFWVFRHSSNLRPKDVYKAAQRDFTCDCHLQHRHSFQDRSSTRYADEKNGVPNLLDPTFGYLLNRGLLTINLANDLKSQAANGSAEASLQVAWCYLHGWGSERSRDEFHRYFTQAIMGESLTALESLPMIAEGEGQDFLHPSIPNKEKIMRRSTEAVLNAVSRHPDISSAAFLETWEPEKFADKVMSLRISSENTRTMDACICSETITDLQTQQIQHASRVGDFEGLENLIREAKKACTSPLDLSVPLLEACARGHAFIVLFIMQEGANPCAKDVNGRSPLHFLARFDDDMVRNVGCVLLDDGASLSTTDNSGLTPLAFVLDGEKNFLPSSVHMAAKFLIENGASIDGSDANAPFTKALLTGDVRLVHLLETSLDSKKLSEGTAEEGQYFVGAINAAVTEALKEPEALRLRKRGAWKHHFVHGLNDDLDKHPDLLGTISMLGRSLNPYVWELAVAKYRALDVARLLDSPLDWPPATGVVPPIFILGQIGDLEMTRSLLRRGIRFDFNSGIPAENVNVFHVAAAHRWPVGLLELLCREQQGVVSLKAMVNQLSTVGRCNPFDLALMRGDLPLAEFFRDLGADTNSPHIIIPIPPWLNPDPHNLLPWAPRKPFTILGAMIYSHRSGSDAHLRAIKYVLGMRPSAVICPEEHMNVFHAVWPRWREVPRTKIQPESSDPYDNTNRLFDLLVRNFNDTSLLKVADTWNGATPLHYAAVSGNMNGVRRLLDLGAEVNTIGVTPEELLMRHLIHETGIKPLIESGRLEAPVAQFKVSDPLLYILVEVYQLLVAERLRKQGNLTELEGELRAQRNPYMDIVRISCHLAHDPRTVDAWMNRNITQYTLVQFLPPPTRQDLPSFNFEFVPPGWRDRFIKPLPQSCHKFALDFIYATRKFELCKRFHNCFSDRHTPQHIGWSGSGDCFFDCASSDEQPEISELTRFRDELGRRWGDVKRQSPARYDNHSDPNIPYLKILIPEGNVGWITFGVISHSRKWDGDAVDLQGLAEDSSTCFEIGTIQPDGSVSERHVLGHFADGKSSWANHLMLWKLDTAPQEAREWMTRLTPGTVIGVFPRAKGLGWVNFVKLMVLRFGLEGQPEAGNSGNNSETSVQSSSTN